MAGFIGIISVLYEAAGESTTYHGNTSHLTLIHLCILVRQNFKNTLLVHFYKKKGLNMLMYT